MANMTSVPEMCEDKRNEMIKYLHKGGMTYRKIGELFNISYQRAQQICVSRIAKKKKKRTRMPNVKIPELKAWMEKNNYRIIDLAKLLEKKGHKLTPSSISMKICNTKRSSSMSLKDVYYLSQISNIPVNTLVYREMEFEKAREKGDQVKEEKKYEV